LRQVYRQKGWDTVSGMGVNSDNYPVMSEFFETIRNIADGLEYGREVKDNVRQASVIRIADLLENAGHVVNVRKSMSFDKIMSLPTIMELGRIGSVQDTTLLMGFLLMRLAEEIERHPRPLSSPHVTVVEEAHRLMAEVGPANGGGDPRSSAGEDFANILAEVRGYGEGLVIAEQIPTMLVKGAIGNTFIKIMHWLEDAPSFELFSNIMNLSVQQREYARTLATGFSIARSPSGRPVHIKVPEFGDQDGYRRLSQDEKSDKYVHDFMQTQQKKLGLDDVETLRWDVHLAATSLHTGPAANSVASTGITQPRSTGPWRVEKSELSYFLVSPMKTCLRCRPWHQKRCPFRGVITSTWLKDEDLRYHADAWLEQAFGFVQDKSERWKLLDSFRSEFRKRLPENSDDPRGLFYCYFAHLVDEWQHERMSNQDGDLRKIGADVLIDIDTFGLG